MIAWLAGRIRSKAADQLVIDVGGVGYQVSIPASLFLKLPVEGEEIGLYIHTHVREDTLALFGFLEQVEKDMFLLLMGVSGIGPKLALTILSNLSVGDLVNSIQTSDESRLSAISGIGKKTAARMVLELRDKIRMLAPAGLPHTPVTAVSVVMEEAISALVNLGYKRQLAEESVKKVRQGRSDLAVEGLIKETLSMLSKK